MPVQKFRKMPKIQSRLNAERGATNNLKISEKLDLLKRSKAPDTKKSKISMDWIGLQFTDYRDTILILRERQEQGLRLPPCFRLFPDLIRIDIDGYETEKPDFFWRRQPGPGFAFITRPILEDWLEELENKAQARWMMDPLYPKIEKPGTRSRPLLYHRRKETTKKARAKLIKKSIRRFERCEMLGLLFRTGHYGLIEDLAFNQILNDEAAFEERA